jgi:hypothetical protein
MKKTRSKKSRDTVPLNCLKRDLSVDTTFNPHLFSMDKTPFILLFLFGLVLGSDPDWSENSDTDPE